MKNSINYTACFICVLLITQACKKGPRVLEVDNPSKSEVKAHTGIFSEDDNDHKHLDTPSQSDFHRVKVEEILPTEKYVYLRVTENGEEFWIATLKQEVQIGEMYLYKGGLLKTNFESKEYNRTFDKVYLISSLVKEDHTHSTASVASNPAKVDVEMHGEGEKNTLSEKRSRDIKGSIKISDLIKNISDYEGKTVQLSGECVKINPNILNRNWIHLKDGSMDDYDLVITSDILIPEGSFITLVGKVVLNQDFGSGYKYDVLIEGATMVP